MYTMPFGEELAVNRSLNEQEPQDSIEVYHNIFLEAEVYRGTGDYRTFLGFDLNTLRKAALYITRPLIAPRYFTASFRA